ncbi:MAG: nucleotidyltransferase family protein [Cyclobacteriaceae bacterium]|nr:nucleotidyltransferase family protein [Cyclobacteriaceae bacterium]
MKPDLAQKIEEKVKAVLQKHHVKRGGLFGSIVTGDFNNDSDIDLLIKAAGWNWSVKTSFKLKQELEDVLQMPVDLVEYNAIKPLIKNSILKQERRIYG